MKRLCVFCGSSVGVRPAYRLEAKRLGETLARRRIGLVYGGGRVGLMGALADAALAAGCEVVGVIPESLLAREVGHAGLTDLHVVGSMHERKALMASLADGFMALPGGSGTLDELFEIITWAQLGLHSRPCAILNVESYFNPLIALLDHAVAEGFLRLEHRRMVLEGTDADRLLDRMEIYQAPIVEKWIRKDEA
jgi:uncharacterized protein (TIGR00730 family)